MNSFVVDVMLGTLAKWLRILGYDTLYNPDWNDHQLVRLARAENRVLLTRDRELARRRGVCVLLVASERLPDQIRQVVVDLQLEPARSFSRCPVCNELLVAMDRKTARSRVPPYVARTCKTFKYCPACQRVYWRGTHWQQMDERLAQFWSNDASLTAAQAYKTNLRKGGSTLEPLELAHILVDAIAERLGSNIVMLDMQDVSLLADYFILCNAESSPQFKAILNEVEKQAKAAGGRQLHVEGEASSGWILLDYGSVIVHVFDPELRAYYNLEDLWKEARLVVRIQ
jgi:ribosome silencing factor RsfS/YbeB/iojap